ncbi:DNA (cytosine-5-)-methyltransferase [Mucilaginibacter daejeonensis]|uniref:DNA (cytosine-5-)-methyltransferase n=1 Tax=Mucilaginibacter daejeonensis TaxID=398049 RepID=UPI001D175A13|nr:DNA (cytosine-5-)-methyltransferase [Mucilaginibacter daejeonensis]UEG51943.1 DNA (cytosine-5-)-methyltransferase [Mucilaginibacter daejeonensis]
MAKKIEVVELFAGVGGFRLGLEGWQGMSALSGYQAPIASDYQVIWSDQWEPSTKSQDASKVYEARFGSEGHHNVDIAQVPADAIPDHDMLVGGFPCQDYSVARTLSRSGGLQGKKGVLWWEIHRILKAKLDKGSPVSYVFLENVDRLLKTPVQQRGRDFAIILASLSDLGYAVEWRVINAADHGMPQRRRRTFILAYHRNSPIYKQVTAGVGSEEVIMKDGVFAKAFPATDLTFKSKTFHIDGDLADISERFSATSGGLSPFENAGIMIGRQVTTKKVMAQYEGFRTTLGDLLMDEASVPASYYIDATSLDKWAYLKGAKNEERVNKASGFAYQYNEGGMIFPDPLDRPSRTIITGEGGASPSRFKHVVSQNGKLRRLTPIELERCNMFPDDHTRGVSDIKRAFFMGNALVVGVIEKVGREIAERLNDHQ